MAQQVPVDPAARADDQSREGVYELAPDVAYQRHAIVNVVLIGGRDAGAGRWVLVDAALTGSGGSIAGAAEQRFGPDTRPAAIVLTHGHFDHVGSLRGLAERWDVPIYAHERERPFLDGSRSYPPPDPSVGGGLIAGLSRFFPVDPIDVRPWLRDLPADGALAELPGWRWVATPGHSAGHISLWRESDRLLIVGDAFITTSQESAFAVALQRPELHGPPMYFTPDWEAAAASVRALAALAPEVVVTGHGPALRGGMMRQALDVLARDFEHVAVPAQGRYVLPATQETPENQ